MQRRHFLIGGLSAVSAAAHGQTPQQNTQQPTARTEAGRVELLEGDVLFFDANRQSRRPKVGDAIFEGDSVITGKQAEVHIRMDDGGYIGVRPDTKMRIATYKAEGGSDDVSVFGLLSGSFRSITGWIGKLGAGHYKIITPTATIGVRGTDHEPLVIAPGGEGGDPGTYDRVHTGETSIRTPQGEVSVKQSQAGFTPHAGGAPRTLDRIPAAFRAARNDGRFEGLHDRIHARLEERREQRRQFIQQRQSQRQGLGGQQRGVQQQGVNRQQAQRQGLEERRQGLAERQANLARHQPAEQPRRVDRQDALENVRERLSARREAAHHDERLPLRHR
jgi:hypothetical protein